MKLKLIYFDQPFWRAEIARLCLFMSDIEFEDFRITNEDLSYLKQHGELSDGSVIPFRQLPVLVIEGESIAQTGAIARICGKLGDMYPKDIIEAGKVDQVIDTVTDINVLINPSMHESDPAIKRQMRDDLSSDALPKYFGYLEKVLEVNDSGWFVGDDMTVADIAVWSMLGWIAQGVLDDIPSTLPKTFERLTRLYNEMSRMPKVQEWKRLTYAYDESSTGEYNYHVPDSI
jgi:glutathione S-transferase